MSILQDAPAPCQADLASLHSRMFEARTRLDTQNDLCDRLQSMYEAGRCSMALALRAEETYDQFDRAYKAARDEYEAARRVSQ